MERLAASANAGATYFATVFLLGFAVGIVRVLVFEPEVGAFAAVALELPLMLAASWFACATLVQWFAVDAGFGDRTLMGAVAFILLFMAELGLSVAAGGTTEEFFLRFADSPAQLGLIGQVIFALFPLIQGAWPKVSRQ